MNPSHENGPMAWQNRLSALIGKRWFVPSFIAVIVLAVLAGHHSLEVIDRDEARFAQASKQMLLSGDFITPRFMDDLRAKKPVGIYWLQSASAAVAGHMDIASYRLPSVLGMVVSLFLTGLFARRLWPPCGDVPHLPVLAMLLLAASPVVLAEAHLAKTDSVLLAVIIAQQLFLWLIYSARNADTGPRHYIGFWVMMGLGILLKGPIAPLVGLTTIAGLTLAERRLCWLRRLCAGRGLVLVAVIVLPWVIAVSMATDGAFLGIAIQGDFLSKIKQGQESHGAPFGTYSVLLAVLFWPGLAFAGFLFWQGRRLAGTDQGRFCLAWLAGYWLVIELVPTKLPHYILPVLPALALLVAQSLFAALPTPRRWQLFVSDMLYVITALWGVCLTGLCFWLAARYGGHTGGQAALGAAAAGLFSMLIIWRLWHWRQVRHIADLLLITGAGIAVHLLVITAVFANLGNVHIAGRLAAHIKALADRPAPIALVGYHEPSAVFHLGQDILLLPAEEAALFMAEAADGLAVVEARHEREFSALTDRLGLQLILTDRVSGLNLSRGRPVTLNFYQHRPRAAPAK